MKNATLPFRVLIAEDQVAWADLYKAVVRGLVSNAVFVQVGSEEEAVESAEGASLIFMDGQLLPGNGVIAIRRIREAGVKTPIIFCSSSDKLVEQAAREPRVVALTKFASTEDIAVAYLKALEMG